MSGRGFVCEREDLDRQSDTVSLEQNNQNSTTTRKNKKWSKEENMFIIECYFRSNPSRLRYGNRMLQFFITEQWLVYQANNIRRSGWLTEIKTELDNGNKNDADPNNVQETNTTTMSEEERLLNR